MRPKAARYVAGAAIALSLTGCKDAGRDTAEAVAPAPSDGVRASAAQKVLAEMADRASRVTSVRGAMSTTSGAPGEQNETRGSFVYRLKPTAAMRFYVPAARIGGRNTGGFTEIVVGGRLYMYMPDSAAETDKPWASVRLSEVSRSTGPGVLALSQGDPAHDVRMFTASTDVRQVGRETVGGVRTTHYRGTFGPAAGVAKLGGEQRAEERKALAQVGTDTLVFDVWVDGRRLPRKVVWATPPGSEPRMTLTTNYTAFNMPVRVTAPPKSQVEEDPALFGAGNDAPG
ncbi:hypothetical protein [Actinoallomurus iriomotensis]|uniref:Lipoprotein n=1 Tax=Actinoallomurus iriomotensis TaxID=478107 RepID=A0A9W6RIA8_9ACTN|nr:hypothetical protein [Actinoallomurus iriomotensis]GLY76586.1 putative lipoprotein [Actinoallomurus iriomotensis]